MNARLALVLFLAACNQDLQVAKVSPTLELQPAPVDLGDVLVGSAVSGDVALVHVSGGEVNVANVELVDSTGFFAWDGLIPEVPSGGAGSITITYTPGEAGYHEAELSVTYNNEAQPTETVRIRGRGVSGDARVYPGLLDFGMVPDGDSRTERFVVVNDGDLDLSLAGASFSASDFVIDDALPITVPAGEEKSVTVRFDSPTDDAVEETMTLDFGGAVVLSDVVLRANDCERGDPAVYDRD